MQIIVASVALMRENNGKREETCNFALSQFYALDIAWLTMWMDLWKNKNTRYRTGRFYTDKEWKGGLKKGEEGDRQKRRERESAWLSDIYICLTQLREKSSAAILTIMLEGRA